MNPKLQKIIGEIEKTRGKITDLGSRLRELERQKTELENTDIVALVRGIDIDPSEFAEFVKAYKERRKYAAPEKYIADDETISTDKEDFTVEN